MIRGGDTPDKTVLSAGWKVTNPRDCATEKGHFQKIGACWLILAAFNNNNKKKKKTYKINEIIQDLLKSQALISHGQRAGSPEMRRGSFPLGSITLSRSLLVMAAAVLYQCVLKWSHVLWGKVLAGCRGLSMRNQIPSPKVI